MKYKDRFNKQSAKYAKFRVDYPQTIFNFLSNETSENELAWDCATGTGQAARSLSKIFNQVVATDISVNQIEKATAPENVDFRVSPAERIDLPDNSVNLITIAQAIHWFDLEKFYPEAKRVLSKDGILSAWGYGFFNISPEIDKMICPVF